MVFIYAFFEIMATFLESYFCFRFNNLFVSQNMPKKKCVIMSVLLTLIILYINYIQLVSLPALVIGVIFVTFTNHIMFKVPLFDTFSLTIFFSFCLSFFDFFSMTIIGLFLENNKFAAYVMTVQSGYRCIFLCVSKLLLVLTYLAVKKLLIYLNRIKSRSLFLITVSGYLGIGYYARFILEYIDFNLAVNWFTLSAIIVLMLFSIQSYTGYQKEMEQKKIIEMRNRIITDNYADLSNSYRENSQLHHDMKNHILVLRNLFENENYTEAGKYLNSLSEVTLALNHTWTGNDVIDCILNIKKTACEQQNINIIIEADPIAIDLDGLMVSIVMANLIDNAIEASMKLKNKPPCIRVAIRHINDMLFLKIQNPVDDIPDFKNGTLLTTKDDNTGRQHGWGLKSVTAAVKKADGVFRYYYSNGEFVSLVTFFL